MKNKNEQTNIEELIKKAMEMLEFSYAPYSNFHVGAALLGADNKIYTGCNIENASYPCGICAERTAMSKAISEGKKSFSKIAIAGSSDQICTPCGLCRQFMYEFAPDLTVLCSDDKGNFTEKKLNAFLPDGFGPESL